MPATTTIEVVGVKQTINSLRKIDPQLQKDFKADATAIAQPAINAGKAVYKELPLSGMKYKWTQRDRKLFPYTTTKAVNGVRMRFDTRRNAVGVILIEQKDPAAAIFETAGRANANKLGNALGFVGAGRTRLIGPAVYKARRGIEAEMQKMIIKTIRTVQSEI
jgi:ERCC4-related helicase